MKTPRTILVEGVPQKCILAPNGTLITAKDLPLSISRWTMARKLLIMSAISGEIMTLEEAAKRYYLSEEEFESWKTLDKKHGHLALRSTHLQEYRGDHIAG